MRGILVFNLFNATCTLPLASTNHAQVHHRFELPCQHSTEECALQTRSRVQISNLVMIIPDLLKTLNFIVPGKNQPVIIMVLPISDFKSRLLSRGVSLERVNLTISITVSHIIPLTQSIQQLRSFLALLTAVKHVYSIFGLCTAT